ncbi:MAG: D-alanyl-D-alanine carboxypeptidase/D-alanyl-D-alanine-endopeptidase [Rhodobacterales bacterium 17-64-5]|nr:MAG: D-alanyl-D-alanine carboxypeptidase/D-alanyl-D-alanine-endopeptidase [Rhodobacterales bacterium 17-64-5]
MSSPNWTRRWVLGAMAAGLAAPALAKTKKPKAAAALPAQSPAEMLAAARLTGTTGYCVAEVASGRILESLNADALLPPASVAKAITSLYALEQLGADHQFTTRVLATGPVTGDRLDGDLILAGGGDPTLDTDTMGDMAAALARTGLRKITGRFLVYAGALPAFDRITDEQPVQVGYDPGLSGLSLNFNRVNFEWTRGGATLQMNARGQRFVPVVQGIKVQVAERDRPPFTYSGASGESWTVARTALAKAGSRWLPVRQVAPYVAEVFTNLCGAQGIALPRAQIVAALPAGAQPLLTWPSARLNMILRDMLKFSTNITAETIGLAASGAPDLRSSAAAMQDWARRTLGLQASFVDHSGLGAASRVTPAGMMRAIMAGERRASGAGLRALLKEMSVRGPDGTPVKGGPVRIRAKSGTLNFVSGLVGFIEPPSGRDLAFAIFSADPARREAVPVADRERPPGERSWVGRARGLQGGLLSRWAAMV